MTSIERAAYPRLKRRPFTQELADVYTPTVEDLAFIRATARGPSSNGHLSDIRNRLLSQSAWLPQQTGCLRA